MNRGLSSAEIAVAPLELLEFFEKSLDHVCVAGLDGYFKHLSASWSKTLGWSPEELLAKPSIEFVHPEDRPMTLEGRQRLRDGGELGPLVNRYLCKNGSFRWFEWRSVADTQRGLVHCVARDITEQREAEARLNAAMALQEDLKRQLIFTERMASVGTLAAGVAHEINTPLSFITTNLSLVLERLQAGGPADDASLRRELEQLVREAMTGAERIRRTVSALKTFSRSEREQRSVLEVQPLLELSINMTASEIRHRARLVREYGRVPPIEADDARLGQVFINLLLNAAQAIPEEGGPQHEIRVVTLTDGQGRAVIEVHDSGPGVPSHLASRIFEPFFTTKPIGVGTGLGLSISHAIVTAMGGSLELGAQSGSGAVFRVVMPAATRVDLPPSVMAAPSPAPIGLKGTVLVVDDEPAMGTMLVRVLAQHEVTTATSARQALELLEQGKSFDVIISDVMMPGMSGVGLYEELSRRFPVYTKRLVFLSGGAFSATTKAFLQGLENERIDKPFDPNRVRDVVRQMVAARRNAGHASGSPST